MSIVKILEKIDRVITLPYCNLDCLETAEKVHVHESQHTAFLKRQPGLDINEMAHIVGATNECS